jgi:predicted N-acyltransferase
MGHYDEYYEELASLHRIRIRKEQDKCLHEDFKIDTVDCKGNPKAIYCVKCAFIIDLTKEKQ